MKIKKQAILAMVLAFVFLFSVVAYAEPNNNDAKVVKTSKVKLNKDSDKEYDLDEILDNGNTIYAFRDVDVKDREEAFQFLNKKISSVDTQTEVGTNLGMNGTYYCNDFQYDSRTTNAGAYSWARIYITGTLTRKIDSEGGHSGVWYGSGTPNSIVLNQTATFNGTGFTISWPPSMSGSSTSRTWTSQPITGSSSAAASHQNLHAECIGFTSIIFSDVADIYIGAQIYRPTTYLAFSGWY